jgi:hypothetical protein
MKEKYHAKFIIIMQIIYQWKRLTYFNNHIVIIMNLANKGKKSNWCSIMLTQMLIELTRWIEHHKQIATWLAMPDKKTTCYFKLVIKVCLWHWFISSKEYMLVDSSKP